MPEIHDVRAGGTEIVMERIDGPMMMDAMLHKPWLMGALRPTCSPISTIVCT